MKQTKQPKRPAPIAVGPIRAKAMRPPLEDDGRWYWRAQIHEEGTSRDVWTGRGTVAEVERLLAQRVASDDLEKRAGGAGTVRDLFELWLGHREQRMEARDLSEMTYYNNVRKARVIVSGLGDTPILSLQGKLEAYKRDRLKVAAPATVIHELSLMHTAWEWARREKVVPDVSLTIPHVRMRATRDSYTPTAEEVGIAVQHMPPNVADAAQLLFATGCRISEITSLRWESVTFADVVVGGERREAARLKVVGKTGAREVWVTSSSALAVLERTPPEQRQGYVLRFRSPVNISNRIANASIAAGQPRWSAQALRRLAVETLHMEGIDIFTAAKMLGHSERVAFRNYRRLRPANLIEATVRAGLGEAKVAQVIRFERKVR